MNNVKQLWSYTDADCNVPIIGGNVNGIKKRQCENAPVMHWPDGTVCWPVTSWLLSKYKKLSTKSARGGSAGTYASQISHLVRYIYKNGIQFIELTDDHMYDWSEDLRSELDLKNGLHKRRDHTQVGRIMRRGFDFLKFYQDNFLINKVIVDSEPSTAQIKVTRKEGKRGDYSYSYLDHPSIPKNSVPQDVKPVGHSIITSLYDAIPTSTNNKYVRKRRQQLLRLLESTGGRRIEVSELLCSDILQAQKTERLLMRVAKFQGDKYREIPLAKEWIEPIVLFIKTYREQLVKRLIKSGKIDQDPGYLFLSETDGKKLNEETITKEISILRQVAGINEKTCAHMFRHRFITIQVLYRLKDYIGKELPMDTAHVILTKVASITGHKRPLSLMPYIDLAYQEMGVWDTAEKVLMLRSKAEAAFRQIQILKNDVDEGLVKGKLLIDLVSETIMGVLNDLNDIQVSKQRMLQV